jgi:hypothetical protein
VQEAPHTAHGFVAVGRSASTDFFALSNISGEMIGSATVFLFIVVFTIEQISGMPNTTTSTLVRAETSLFGPLKHSVYLTCLKPVLVRKSAARRPHGCSLFLRSSRVNKAAA